MFLANLALAQLIALFGAVAAIMVALYLLDRSRRRLVVPSLQFWRNASRPIPQRRWRIREPISLLLQLLGILLLLLAVGQLRLGSVPDTPRDHVLLLDTSAWMASRGGDATLMELAREEALAYIRELPARDRVMLIRAGVPPLPVTGFESDRRLLEEAIQGSAPDSGALDIAGALDTADRIRSAHSRRPGEIVYVGAGRTTGEQTSGSSPTNLRYLPVGDSGALDNVGLQRIGLRHSVDDWREWDVYVALKNYGASVRDLQVSVQFASSPAAYREVRLAAGGETEFSFPLRSRAAGTLEVRLFPDDSLSDDNYAAVRLPPRDPVQVAVYSRAPDRWRPLLTASPMVQADYRPPGSGAADEADLYIIDRCAPGFVPERNAIWILPPAEVSPVEFGWRRGEAEIVRWDRDHPVTTGLRTQDLTLGTASGLEVGEGDEVLAETGEGAVAIARPGRIVVLGFDPLEAATRYELAAPLLIANAIRWVKPDVFRQWELTAGPPGAISAAVGAIDAEDSISVAYEDGEQLPFAVDGETLHFFAGRPGMVRITTPSREIVYSLNLPHVAGSVWDPPAEAARGLPGASVAGGSYAEVWYWLALAGALCLLYEWLRYGRRRTAAEAPSIP